MRAYIKQLNGTKMILSARKKLIINKNITLEKALKMLQENKNKILFVIDKRKRLIGSLTDGDVRRALIKNIKVQRISDIMNRRPFFLKKKTKTINENKKKFLFAPLLNKNKNIIDIIDLKKEILNLDCNLVLLAGGKGKRLLPLTKKIPKPIIKFGKISHLSKVLKNFINLGFRDIFVCINYLGNKVIKDLAWVKKEKINFSFVKEKNFLGTAGPLSIINFNNNKPILVLNSDIITDINYEDLLISHKKSKSLFTVCVKYIQNKVPFGVIKQKNNSLIDIEEKPNVDYLFNLGVYVISQKLLGNMKKNTYLDMPNFIKNLLRKKVKINCHYVYEDWFDYGTKDNLKIARKKYKN